MNKVTGAGRFNAVLARLAIFVLLGFSASLHAVEPPPESRKFVFDFLRSLQTVIENDDLADQSFLENKLGVKLVNIPADSVDSARWRLYLPRPIQDTYAIEGLPQGVAELLAGNPRIATLYYTKLRSDGKTEAGLQFVFPYGDSRPSCITSRDVGIVFGDADATPQQEKPTPTFIAIHRYKNLNLISASFASNLYTHCMSGIYIVQNGKE